MPIATSLGVGVFLGAATPVKGGAAPVGFSRITLAGKYLALNGKNLMLRTA